MAASYDSIYGPLALSIRPDARPDHAPSTAPPSGVLPRDQSEMGEFFDKQIAEAFVTLERPTRVARIAQLAIAGELCGGNPAHDRVAVKIGMSTRTLQRRLQEEQTSHKDLLTELRRELSTRYLRHDKLTTSSVAFLLGYADVSAFHRAFRRWTATTPAAYRRSARPTP